uniref:Piwi domain-containing protein n=1 Tax=Panagrellus redivivus TaxID=6233 RepID=A0A7E4W7S0_PANRE
MMPFDEFPSVVGLVGNVKRKPSIFVGNFFYQQSRNKEVITPVFGNYIKNILKQLVNSDRRLISTVTILRHCVNEKEVDMVVHKELPLIKKACAEFMPKWKPRFLIATAIKRPDQPIDDRSKISSDGSSVTDKVDRPVIVLSNCSTR